MICLMTRISRGACVCWMCPRLESQGQCISASVSAGLRMQGEILDSAHDFVVQLADIFDYVTPCFPEKYGIFRVIFREYHQHLSFMLDCIGCCAEQLSNSDILKVGTFA